MKIIKRALVVLFVLCWIFQLVGIHFYGLQAINIVSSILFLGLLYIITKITVKAILNKLSIEPKLTVNISHSITSLFITLTLLEIVLRLFNVNATYMEQRTHHYHSPYTTGKSWFHGWTMDHNLVTPEYNYVRKVNRELLSDTNHPVKKRKNEYRIIGLGDSFTEGDGAHADSTWLKALDRKISRDNSQSKFTFMNAGISGSDVFFEYILLKKKLLKYEPDLVLLALNNSDISDVVIRGGMKRFIENGTVKFNNAPRWEPIFAVSYVTRFLLKFGLNYNDIFVKNDGEEYEVSRNEIFQSLLLFQELALEYNFKFLVIFHPVKKEIRNQKLDLADVLLRVQNETEIENLNLLNYFTEVEGINSANYERLFWKYDGHHNANGYEKFANGIEWKLKKMKIIYSDSTISKNK